MLLALPQRTSKPRSYGLTNILDKGQGAEHIRDSLRVCPDGVDMAKLGWGTSLVTRNLREKIDAYREFSVDVCLGGTLFEKCFAQGRLDDFVGFLKENGLGCVEISDGTVQMTVQEKLGGISRLAREFRVFSEVGSKDREQIHTPAKWVLWIKAELEAGASYVILEGRESGTVGIFRDSGEIREGLIDEILDAGIDPRRLVFEAPRKHQQVWFLKRVGPNANLANIPLEEVVSLETLRLGLRADTFDSFGEGAALE